jgi:23S rRNA (pseudouridine1915-N3)-methyltransferase
MGQRIRLLAVGKLREPFYRKAADHYAAKIAAMSRFDLFEIKDASKVRDPADRAKTEGASLLGRLSSKDIPLLLDERGEEFTSRQWAALLQGLFENPAGDPCFVLGGPFGVGPEARDKAARVISLGRMTMPHELARVALLEQIYRALTILAGSPYHHD